MKRIVLSGRYGNDLAQRFSFTAIDPARITVEPEIASAAELLKADGSEDLYVVTCFSDKEKILSLTEKEGK